MNTSFLRAATGALVLGALASVAPAQVKLIAIGTLQETKAGPLTDLSGLNYTLESGAPANILGGLGSGLGWAGGNTFLAVPDRGPNATLYNSAVDDTVSYVTRFHTLSAKLSPASAGSLPFTVTPAMRSTTLMSTLLSPLTYGTGTSVGLGSGAPPSNTFLRSYFSGRSDNFDATKNSGNPADARFDPESIRLSNDRRSVFLSDEYGPYIYQFDRISGIRTRTFTLPSDFYVTSLSPVGNNEISGNTVGRTANKGMEGLAITPDGTTLVGIMQNALLQDTAAASKLLRIVTIDIASGAMHQYAYTLTDGSGTSDIVAINNTEFLVDERDGKGRGDGSAAKIKKLYKINLAGATDVTGMDGATALSNAVAKSPFLDLVQVLVANGTPAGQIPAKIEGIAFGADVDQDGTTLHTLWIANDNDFLPTVADDTGTTVDNPNQFFVFGFTDADLAGSPYLPQQFTGPSLE